MKQVYRLISKNVQQNAVRFIEQLQHDADRPLVVTISESTRTLEQNALMWPLLQCLARQTDWHGIKLSEDEWKDLLSAGLKKCKVVPNMDNSGFVIVGQRTSKMNKKEFSELVELIYAFGAERSVDFERRYDVSKTS